MNKPKISSLTISDIHLGHNRTKTEYIIQNLDDMFKKNHAKFKKLDIIFLAGDVYDKLLSTNSKEFNLSLQWLCRLAMYCGSNKIMLRILEGTPSHDWGQNKVLTSTVQELKIPVDFKYIDTVDIEVMDALGISVLYVPDEVNHNAQDTYEEVKAVMRKYDISQVDMCIMHGHFDYQLPMIELESSHVPENYLEIVKYYIMIGHIHTFSVYSRIIAQGSFDRLAHNEEEDKGCVVTTIYHTGEMEFTVIKNRNAMPYISYDISDMETNDIVKYLDKVLPKLKLKSKVSLRISNTSVMKIIKPVQERYKDLEFTVVKKKEIKTEYVKKTFDVHKAFEITKRNIMSLLEAELLSDGTSSVDICTIKKELTTLM